MIKKHLSLILLILLFFTASCSTTAPASASVSIQDLATEIESAVPLPDGYYRVSNAYFNYYFPDVTADEWVICRSSSQSSENEFGIISASGNAAQVKSACENYLKAQLDSYMASKASYSPSEYEKYRDASVKVFGNYVIYAIMTMSDQKSAFSSAESMIYN